MKTNKFQTCQECLAKNQSVITYRQNTSYVEDEKNIVTLCSKCKKENDDHWRYMWAELNSSIFS